MYSSNRVYEASVYVNGRPVKEVHHRGRTYIEGRRGTEYTLHFRNKTGNRVLVIPSVDGLSVFDGKPAGKDSSGIIVDGYGSVDIPGWMVDSSTAAKFEFRPQDARNEKTYVEELSREGARVDTGNQGLIGFMVIEEKQKSVLRRITTDNPGWGARPTSVWHGSGDPMVMMSSASASVGSNSNLSYTADANTGLGTGFGEATEFNTVTAEFDRGRKGAEMVIEYDTLRGLKDRGVPVHLFKGGKKGYYGKSAFPADGPGCKPPKGWRK